MVSTHAGKVSKEIIILDAHFGQENTRKDNSMQTKRIFMVGSFLLLSITSKITAQESSLEGSTRNIKDIYEYVLEQIRQNRYYLNEFKINSGNRTWANQKRFYINQQYYYSFIGDDTPVLRMVRVDRKNGEDNYYQEYLYDNLGKLIFCYERQNDRGQYNYRELAAYYEQDLCINLYLDQELIEASQTEHAPKTTLIAELGKFYAYRFQEDMQRIGSERK